MIKTQNLWTEQAPRPADLPVSREFPDKVDVAVVGSGYTGLTAAITLAKSGAAVAVLEKETIGWGASSRNGSMATPGLKRSLTEIFKEYGPHKGREFWQMSLDALDLIERYITEEQITCDWHRDGCMVLAYKEKHFKAQAAYARWMKEQFDYDLIVVPREELKTELGTEKFYGGLADPNGGGLQPAKYVFGLARAAARHGAQLYEDAEVTAIQKQEQGFEITTARGRLRANEVIMATNGYTEDLPGGLKAKVFPVGSYIIVTEPLDPELQKYLSPKRRMFYDSKWFLNYFCITPDGRMLWGGRNNLSTDLDLLKSADILQKQMVETFPELADIPITNSWTGKLGITFDLMPHIGLVKGVHYALGYGGHGLAAGTYLGTEIGLLLSGQKTRSPFEEIPHQTMIFYRKQPWFIPLAAQYYRVLDWLT